MVGVSNTFPRSAPLPSATVAAVRDRRKTIRSSHHDRPDDAHPSSPFRPFDDPQRSTEMVSRLPPMVLMTRTAGEPIPAGGRLLAVQTGAIVNNVGRCFQQTPRSKAISYSCHAPQIVHGDEFAPVAYGFDIEDRGEPLPAGEAPLGSSNRRHQLSI